MNQRSGTALGSVGVLPKAENLEKASRLSKWRELLERCGRKPTQKRVHALRTLTLRLQAELESRSNSVELGPADADIAMRWGRQAEKLRRALSPVREIDVWLAKLAELPATIAGPDHYSPPTSLECVRQIEQLQNRLQRKRRGSEKKLMAAIEGRKKRLEKAGRELEASRLTVRSLEVGTVEIVEQFGCAVAEFPSLAAENLHEFRKRIKAVRYLAEMTARADAEAGRLGTQLKKVQSAIGEWHDWQELAAKAQQIHGRHGDLKDLSELLETLAAESLEKALDVCSRTTDRLLAHREDAAGDGKLLAMKFPVLRAVPNSDEDSARLA